MQYLDKISKWQNDRCSFPKQTFSNIVIQVYAPTSNPEETEVEWFYKDLQELLEHPKIVSFLS